MAAPRVFVYGKELVVGRLNREQVVEIVTEFASRHANVRRQRKIIVRFVADARVDGVRVGGWQMGNRIAVAAKSLSGYPLDVFDLVTALYHELTHMADGGNQMAASGLFDHSELHAIQNSVRELMGWVDRQVEARVMAELATARRIRQLK